MTGYGQAAPAYGRGQMRAADADRNWALEFLKTAYTEGRLTKDDYDHRAGRVLSAKTYADMDAVLVDLPRPGMSIPAGLPQTNSLAIASLVCGICQVILWPLVSIPAVVLGHVARHQIRRTGEAGSGMALAGLILGWIGIAVGVLAFIGILLLVVGFSHPVTNVHINPGPGG